MASCSLGIEGAIIPDMKIGTRLFGLLERAVVAFEQMAQAQQSNAHASRRVADLRVIEVDIAKRRDEIDQERIAQDRRWWATWSPDDQLPPRRHVVELMAASHQELGELTDAMNRFSKALETQKGQVIVSAEPDDGAP